MVLSTGFITIQQIKIREANCVTKWLEIYSVDSIIHLSNGWPYTAEWRNDGVEWEISFPLQASPIDFETQISLRT